MTTRRLVSFTTRFDPSVGQFDGRPHDTPTELGRSGGFVVFPIWSGEWRPVQVSRSVVHVPDDPVLLDGADDAERRATLARLQEESVRSDRWLPDIVRFRVIEEDADPRPYERGYVVVHVAVRTVVEVDEDDRATIDLGGRRIEVSPDGQRLAGETLRSWVAAVRQRNLDARRTLRSSERGIVRVPSTMTGMLAGAPPPAMSMQRRRRLVRAAATMTEDRVVDIVTGAHRPSGRVRVSVAWSDLARERLVDHDDRTGRRRRGAPGPALALWLDRPAETTSDQLWAGALDLLQCVSSDSVASLFSLIVECCERGGWFAAIPATIARHRGIDPASMSTKRRQSFREHLRLWTEAELEVTPLGSRPMTRAGITGEVYQRFPILTYDRTIGVRGVGEVPVYRLHDELWRSMQAGRGWYFDRAALGLNLHRDDLSWRLYSRLTGRWSVSWRTHPELRRSGGLVRVRLVDLLDGPGVDWRRELRQRGEGPLLSRVERALDELVRWPVRPLLADARLIRGNGPIESMEVEARPTASLVEALGTPRGGPREPTKREARRRKA